MPGDEFKHLSSDLPLKAPAEDELGYAPFARQLAKSIMQMPYPEGYVIALNGAWGLGKSTVVSFVLHYLREETEGQPLICEFSPWMFSGQEDLTRCFFGQLLGVLESDPNEVRRKKLKKVVGTVTDYAAQVNIPPVLMALLPMLAAGKVGADVLSKIFKEPQKDIHELKSKVEQALREYDRRILVVIDDIDRLHPEEMQQLFRVVKAIANFPNVIYLLAFDKEIVSKALTNQAIKGEAYLEKIVQSPFDIPLPGKSRLGMLFVNRLNLVLGEIPNEIFDQNYWHGMVFEGIQKFFKTPRHVIRLLNSLTAIYPMVRDEVNPVDLVALETLRLFCPQVYDTIRNHKEKFTRFTYISTYNREREQQEEKQFHDAWLQQVPEAERDQVKAMVQLMFPALETVFRNMHYSPEHATQWRRQLRICSPARFDVYFNFMLPQGVLPNIVVKAFLAKTEDKQALVGVFDEILSTEEGCSRQIRTYLGELGEYATNKMPVEHIPHVVETLLVVGDNLILHDEKQHMLDFGSIAVMNSIIHHVLKRLPEQQGFEILKNAMQNGQALSLIVHIVEMAGSDHDRYGDISNRADSEKLLLVQHVEELETLAAEKLSDASRNGSLLYSPVLLTNLLRWRNWSGEDAPRNWLNNLIENDAGLIALLGQLLGESRSKVMGEYTERVTPALGVKVLEPILDIQEIDNRLTRLLSEGKDKAWNARQTLAVAQFQKEFAALQSKSVNNAEDIAIT